MDDIKRQYRLIHQSLEIRGLNFKTRSLVGYVTLHLQPVSKGIRSVLLNCKQCTIFEVVINQEEPAKFCYNDPTLDVCCEGSTKSVTHFQTRLYCAIGSLEPDENGAELTVEIPKDLHDYVDNLKPFTVTVEFSLERPQGGVQYVVPVRDDGSVVEDGVHMFTYSRENDSRLWFPCIDSFCEPCTWDMQFTVPATMTAVSSGDLVDTVVSPDMKTKTFRYHLPIPTSAHSIGLAVGHFEIIVDQHMHEVTHFCLPHLMPVLKETTAFLHEVFEYFEEMLSSRYPYACYKQVFIDEAYEDVQVFSTLSILNVNLLRSNRIIDQTPETKLKLAHAVAQQFFGCFIAKKSYGDAWLTVGISNYLKMQYQKTIYGNNEYRYVISQMMDDVQQFERDICKVVLNPFTDPYAEPDGLPPAPPAPTPVHINIQTPHMVPARYYEVFAKKATLIIRLLEIRIGKELLVQVLNKLLSLATKSSLEDQESGMWVNLHITTPGFAKSITTVTGKEVGDFFNRWVHQGGCSRFFGDFKFNPKRNVVEMELRQDMNAKGGLKYVGPLTVVIQELDGSFRHEFKIEENKYRFEITCHSKSRRNKKKKIPLSTQEEVDMDLSAMDSTSPVLWIRVDPDMHLLRVVTWEQPDFMWQYQARYERDVIAQLEAISALSGYPGLATRRALTDTMENEHIFYRVRVEAARCLAKVANSMAASWTGPPAMTTLFRKLFGSHADSSMVRQNRFTNLQHYYLQRAIPEAMATLRDPAGICPPEVVRFILNLFLYNNNDRNKYADGYYRASLVDALAKTITPSVTVASAAMAVSGGSEVTLSDDMRAIVKEVTLCLNLEKVLPSYKNVITVSCLKALRVLQRNGHIPSSSALFKTYAQYGIFQDVRLAAIEILAGFVHEGYKEHQPDLLYILDLAQTDPVPYVRYRCVSLLAANPPFTPASQSPELNESSLAEKLWAMMNSSCYWDTRLRCEVVKLFAVLYGTDAPPSLAVKTPSSAGPTSSAFKLKFKREDSQSNLEFGGSREDPTVANSSETDPATFSSLLPTTQMEGDDSLSRTSFGEDSQDPVKAKKKKKKNKHKHKHKRMKKEREDDGAENLPWPSQQGSELMTSSYQGQAVDDNLLVLSEPSSPELEVGD